MTLFQRFLPQSFALAGSLSMYSATAQAQPAIAPGNADLPQGRAGIATLCIETRSYVDPASKKIVTPMIYLDTMPKEGIATGYVKGNALANRWNGFLNPAEAAAKEWMKSTDIEEQAEDAIEVITRLDKSPMDGMVSFAEFETGEKGRTDEDKRTDLGLLKAFQCSSAFLLKGRLNTVDLDAFPEVKALKRNLTSANHDLSEAKNRITSLEKEREGLEQDRARIWRKMNGNLWGLRGLGALSLLLGAGLVVSLARKRPSKAQKEPVPPTPKPEAPADKKEPAASAPDPQASPKPAVEDIGPEDMDDVLDELKRARQAESPAAQAPAVAADDAGAGGEKAEPVPGVQT